MSFILKDFFFMQPSASREGGPSSNPEFRREATSGQGLKVTFAASHAGMVNHNSVMYSAQGMKNSTHTWTYPLPRPVQIHHDDMADPIGRIVSARFVPYNSSVVSEEQQDAFSRFRDAVTKDDIVEGARMIEDAGVLGSDAWKGVGELVLDAIITDSSAIEKVLDGRYLGLSISQIPNQAFCSICEQDWLKDGPCEHARGEIDEESKRKQYLIVGDTRYLEASYVNQPADEFAQNLQTSPVQLDDNMQGTLLSVDKDESNQFSMRLVDSIQSETDEDPAEEVQETETEEVPLEDNESQEDSETEEETSEEEENPDFEETVARALEVLFSNEESFTEEEASILNEALEQEVEELEQEDAKLSPEKRKSLPKSAFCGPNRSFPVHDCAHYTAAKRLIGRYKGPGDKSKIKACIERKGKALGCSGAKKKDKVESEEEVMADQTLCLDKLENEALGKVYLDCEKLMVARGLKFERTCEDCQEKDAQISDLEVRLPELEDKVSILREEWKLISHEHVASEESHASTLTKYEAFMRDYLYNALLLTDKISSTEDIDSKVKAMGFEELQNSIKEIDFSEIIFLARNGLTQEPEEEVTPEEADFSLETPEFEERKIAERLVNFQKRYGTGLAVDYLHRNQIAGKIPQDMDLAKAAKLMAE